MGVCGKSPSDHFAPPDDLACRQSNEMRGATRYVFLDRRAVLGGGRGLEDVEIFALASDDVDQADDSFGVLDCGRRNDDVRE